MFWLALQFISVNSLAHGTKLNARQLNRYSKIAISIDRSLIYFDKPHRDTHWGKYVKYTTTYKLPLRHSFNKLMLVHHLK